jgi:probable HAF family extracellular repeat protein
MKSKGAKSKGVISICLTAILVCAASAAAQYKVVDLGTLGGGISNAYGVNDLTQVVGVSQVAGGFNHGFLWTKPHGMKDLGTLGGNFSSAQAINDASEIVGQAATSQSTSYAFLRKGSTMQDLGSLGGSSSQANAINFNPVTQDFTQIAGWSVTAGNGPYHAVVWDASLNIMDLGTLGGSNSFAFGNNCREQVVGAADTAMLGGSHAFLWDSGTGMQDLGTLGGTLSQANGINCVGLVVGYSFLAGDQLTHAFAYAGGGLIDLGTLGGSVSQANAVNDLRQIVGSSTITGDTDEHAFLWTPQRGMQDLNSFINQHSGWDLRGANSISNNGKIVGSGLHQGQLHAFLLIPE